MTRTTIEVAAWADLHHLPRAMDELGEQLDAVVRHARTWVCNPAGFEPSAACLLRPLAEVMDEVDQAFTAAGRLFAEQWQRLREGVVVAAGDLQSTDEAVASGFAAVV